MGGAAAEAAQAAGAVGALPLPERRGASRRRPPARAVRYTSKCAPRRRRVELHRLLTFLGLALLVATFAIYYSEGGYGGGGEGGGGGGGGVAGEGGGLRAGGGEGAAGGFSMAYVTGIAMLAVFMASFVLFNKERWGKSRR